MFPSDANKSAFMTNTNTPSFGTPTCTFGQTSSNTSIPPLNIFQTTSNSSFNSPSMSQSSFGTNLFGQQQQAPSGNTSFSSSNGFGQKPTSFGFGTAPAQLGAFGEQLQSQTGTSPFQSNAVNLFGGSPNGNQTKGTVIKYSPFFGTDIMQKNGVTHSIRTNNHCITCMREYEDKSLEELRVEDYECNRKGPQQQQQLGFGGTPFSASDTRVTSLSGPTENKPGFGQPQVFEQTPAFAQITPSFGVANQAAAPTLFGKSNTFSAATSRTSTFGFNAVPVTSNPFSVTRAQKPSSQPLFGTTTTRSPPNFGAGVFGQTNTQNIASNSFQNLLSPGIGSSSGQQGFPFAQPTTNLFQVSKANTSFGNFGQANATLPSGSTSKPTFNFAKLEQPTYTQPTQPNFGSNLAAGLQRQPSWFGTAASTLEQPTFTQPTQQNFGANLATGQQQRTSLFGTAASTLEQPTCTQTPQSTFGANLTAGLQHQPSWFGTTAASTCTQPTHPNFGANLAAGQQQQPSLFGTASSTLERPTCTQTTQPTFGANLTAGLQHQPSWFGAAASTLKRPTFTQPTQPTFGANLALGPQHRPSLFGTAASTPSFSNINSTGSQFNGSVFPQTSTPVYLQFPIERTEENSVKWIATDSFSDGPHIYGLESLQVETNSSVTSPTILRQVLDHTSKREDAVATRTKMKVLVPKRNRDFFITNQNLRNSHRCLVIRKCNDAVSNGPTFNSNYKNVLLQEAEDCLRESSSSIIDSVVGNSCSSSISSNSEEEYYTALSSPTNTPLSQGEEHSERLSNYNARIRLSFDSCSDESETKTIEEIKPLLSASNSAISLERLSLESTEPHILQPAVVSLLDFTREDLSISECGERSPVTDSLELEDFKNPAGVILTRPEYYVYPTLKDLVHYMGGNGECVVQGLTIGRIGYGNVYFPDAVDISNMNFDEMVHFRHKEVVVYPDETAKPAIGEGLNRRAQITLDKVYPKDKDSCSYITDINRIKETNFVDKLMQVNLKQNARFVDYRSTTGSWVFKVKHFSEYGFTECNDEECEIVGAKTIPQQRTSSKVAKQMEEFEKVPMRGLGHPQL